MISKNGKVLLGNRVYDKVSVRNGCSGSGGVSLALEEVHQKLQMQSHETEAKITFLNKGSNTYVVLQQAKASGPYRMEILEPENNKGILTISDGTKVVQVDPSIGGKIEAQDTPVRDALLLYPFLQNYLQSEASASSVGVTMASAGVTEESSGTEVESSLTLLETELPGDHPKLAHQKLWVDAYTAAPVKMEITDKSGNPSIVILSEFTNPQLEDSLFSTED
ncbi:MAG: LolA family protein [Clostridia bacterium]